MRHDVFYKNSGEIKGYVYTPFFDFRFAAVKVEDYRIKSVKYCMPGDGLPEILSDDEKIREYFLLKEKPYPMILPGLVDVHLHGAAGFDICDASKESFHRIDEYEKNSGIAAYLGTTMTLPVQDLEKICLAAKSINWGQTPMEDGTNGDRPRYEANGDRPQLYPAGLVGLFLEGPFVSKKKCGAQNPDYAINPDFDLIMRLNEMSGGLIRKVLVAPELDGTEEFVMSTKEDNERQLLESKDWFTKHIVMSTESKQHYLSSCIHITFGHTECDYDRAIKMMDLGVNQITHMYNAMPAFDKRNPGLIGAALDKNCYTELICDGVHVHDSVVRATFEMVSDDRLVLISDSTMATGLPDGPATLGGTPVNVVTEGVRKVTLADGTIAGSATNLFDCMMHAIENGVPISKAIRAASINPAKSIGIDDGYGSIEVGKSSLLNILS